MNLQRLKTAKEDSDSDASPNKKKFFRRRNTK